MLRFLFGASGAGKTSALCQMLIERAQREPERNFLLLVPDQFTLSTQRQMVRAHPAHGIINIDVLSFSRLAHRIFDETGYPAGVMLDDLGKALILRRVAERMKKKLPVIGGRMRSARFADEVKSTLSELMQYAVSPEQVEEMARLSEGRRGLSAKLKDLALLYRGFLAECAQRFRTQEEVYAVIAERMRTARLTRDAVIAFDGFTGFTPVQYLVLEAAEEAGKELIVTLTMSSEADPYAYEAGDGSLFALSKKTVHDLTRHIHEAHKRREPRYTPDYAAFEEARREEAGDIFLPDHPVARYKDNPALAHLERELFRYDARPYEEDASCIRIVQASCVQEEVRQTFRAIRAMLREDAALLYRDFAIVSCTPDDYADEVARAALDFDIPLFQDRTTAIALNPLIEYLLSVPDIAAGNYALPAVMRCLKSGVSPFGQEERDRFENYARAHGIRGRSAYETPFVRPLKDGAKRSAEEAEKILKSINAVRVSFAERMAPVADAFREKKTVREVTRALYGMLTADRVPERMKELAERFRAQGDVQRHEEYRQIAEKVIALLERITALMGGEVLTAAEYGELLEAGCAELSVGTIPQNVDRVIIGDLERTRLTDVKHLFFLGVSDAALPACADGGGFLSEVDRIYLEQVCPQAELAPGPARLMQAERLYLYMNLTKPKETLTLSYSVLNGERKAVKCAYLITRVQQLFPRLAVLVPEQDSLTEQAESRRDIERLMAGRMRDYADGILPQREVQAFLTLFALLTREAEGVTPAEEAAFFSYRAENLSPALARALYGSGMDAVSTTRLERFLSCSYAHFLRYGLRLQEEAEYDLLASDLGNVYHGVLERFSALLERHRLSWTSFDAPAGEEILREAFEDFAKEYGGAVFYDNARRRHLLERMHGVLSRAVQTLRHHLEMGEFAPAYAEKDFRCGIEENGRRVSLFGRIDRVDLAEDEHASYVKVIDFKSGRRDFDISALYYGLSLQLVLYMDAVLQEERKRQPEKEAVPAALLYYRLADPLINTDALPHTKALSEEQREHLLRMSLRTTGIVNADREVLKRLDRDIETEEASEVIPVAYKKGGGFTASSQVFHPEHYALIAAHARRLALSAAEDILRGEIDVNPCLLGQYDACRYCGYKSICGFDERLPGFGYREEETITMEEALLLMKKEEKKRK